MGGEIGAYFEFARISLPI